MSVEPGPVPPGRPFRLATWNMNHWQQPADRRADAWAWLRQASGLDVALVQEAVPPVSLARQHVVYREIAGRRPWGSGVVALGEGIELEEIWAVSAGAHWRQRLALTHPGSVAVARVQMPGIAPISAVSIYNLLEGSPAANLLRVTADLLPLLDSVDGDRVIVGGDLNVYGAVAHGRRTRAGAIFALLAGLGLQPVSSLEDIERPASRPDCPCGSGGRCGHIATWKAIDLDHLFVSKGLAGQVRALRAERTMVERFSDHAALVLDMDLSPVPVARSWDVPSFVAELAQRHGGAAARVAEELVAWADGREQELRRSGIRDRALTEFELPKSIDPTLWLRISFFERSILPQWLVGIHAKTGEISISFRDMHHRPFDTEVGREPLRAVLNGIPRVDIPVARLRGRPRIPIAALDADGALSQLIGVLDRIVDETTPQATDPAWVHPELDGTALT